MDDNRNIYLDQAGNYRDNIEENRAAYPPAAEAAPETPADQETPAGTTTEQADGVEVTPVAPAPSAAEAIPADAEPEAAPKTR